MRLNIVVFLLVSALSALTQGTVRFDNNIPGLLVTHAYAASEYPPRYGNGPNDTPAGTQDYSGAILLSGLGWSAQLWGAPSADANVLSLQPAAPITTFQTGANAGFVVPITVTFDNIPADSVVATLQMRVWDNQGGRITSWNQAVNNAASLGASLPFNVNAIGGPINPPATLVGLQSFSGTIPVVPEPSTSALVGFGLLALWLRSRRGSNGV